MADKVEAWCKNIARNGRTDRVILISGPFGNGKTTTLRAARTYVRDVRGAIWPQPWPHPPQYYSCAWGDFIREQVDENNHEMREDLMESDIVFMDDIGSEEDRFKSGAPTRILGDMLGQLHDEKRFVFITTNIQPDGWRERWDGRVEDRLLRMRPVLINLWPHTQSFSVWRLSQ